MLYPWGNISSKASVKRSGFTVCSPWAPSTQRSPRYLVKPGNKPLRLRRSQSNLNYLPVLTGLAVLLPLLLCSVISYWIVFTSNNPIIAVPISLHSILVADYQVDPHSMKIPPVQLSLIQDALEDQFVNRSNEGLATLVIGLFTPVPTFTPIFTLSNEPTQPAPTQLPVITVAPSKTLAPSAITTRTPSPTATLPNSTLTPTRTDGTPSTNPRISPTPTTVAFTQPPINVPTHTLTPTLAPPTPPPRSTNTPDPYPPPSPGPSPYP